MAEENLTELEAVNRMLRVISEQPVNSLEASGVLEAEIARDVLHDVSRSVQNEDWHFNVEHRLKLLPDSEGRIFLPRNATKAWRDPWIKPRVAPRGNRLYNLSAHTYIFERPVILSIRYFLPFDELLPSAAHYITLRAARQFQEHMTGSQVTEEFVMREEALARAALVADDAEMAGYNVVTDNLPTLGVVRRDRW